MSKGYLRNSIYASRNGGSFESKSALLTRRLRRFLVRRVCRGAEDFVQMIKERFRAKKESDIYYYADGAHSTHNTRLLMHGSRRANVWSSPL